MTASAFSQVSIGGPAGTTAPATQIIEASADKRFPVSVLVYNTSTTVTVWLCESNAYTSADAGTPNVSPLNPQSAIVFSGLLDVFAVSPSGQYATLYLFPSSISFNPQTLITPLVQAGTSNNGSVAFTVPASSFTVLLNHVDVTNFNSLDLNIYAYGPTNTVTGAESMQLCFYWYDSPSSDIPIFEEDWWIYLGTTAIDGPIQGSTLGTLNPLAGNTPMHGKYLSIVAFNIGTNATPISIQYFNLYGSPRLVPYSDWRQSPPALGNLNFANVPIDSTNPFPETGLDNCLASILANPGTASSFAYPLPLYAGPVSVEFEVSGAVLTVNARLVTLNGVRGSEMAVNMTTNILYEFSNTLNAMVTPTINFPRAPVVLMIEYAAASSILFTATGQQAA
jgi:hypothetical protein